MKSLQVMIQQVTKYTRPNLTSINQPIYDIGAIAMRMLTKIMHKEELDNREVILNHGIKERKSTNKDSEVELISRLLFTFSENW